MWTRAVLLVGLTACTVEQGKVPVIDALGLPESVTLDADGTYHVAATISYHDDDDEVRRIRVHVDALSATADYGTPGGKKATSAPFTFQIVGTAPKGPLAISVAVLDEANNASDVKSGSVTLK